MAIAEINWILTWVLVLAALFLGVVAWRRVSTNQRRWVLAVVVAVTVPTIMLGLKPPGPPTDIEQTKVSVSSTVDTISATDDVIPATDTRAEKLQKTAENFNVLPETTNTADNNVSHLTNFDLRERPTDYVGNQRENYAGEQRATPLGAQIDQTLAFNGISEALANATVLDNSTLVVAAAKVGDATLANPNSEADDDYAFPVVTDGAVGLTLVIPDDPLPSRSSRRMISEGEGRTPVAGDVVALSFDMFRWSTGELVQSSNSAFGGPVLYRLNDSNSTLKMPEYLQESIVDRPYGSTVQVVFERGMNDLPLQFDINDGYVVVIRIDNPQR